MKVMITGIAGFVGHHCSHYLPEVHPGIEIIGLDSLQSNNLDIQGPSFKYYCVDLLDRQKVRDFIQDNRVEYLLHLASFSSVSFSWEKPAESFLNNTMIFINLVEAVKDFCPSCRILSIGSSEEYGDIAPSELPVKESHRLRPRSPYGAARISQELLSEVFCSGYGLDIVMTRSFNHIGAYQRESFVVPAFVRQFVQAEREGKSVVKLKVGDIDVVRDFTDVADVVRAYDLLLRKGKKGQVYNVCSGKGHKLRDIVGYIEKIMNIKADIEIDQGILRPLENREIVGDNSKIFRDCGWVPEHDIESSLKSVVEYWRSR